MSSLPIFRRDLVAETRPDRHHDVWLLVAAGLLILTGFLAIYSVDSIKFNGHYTIRQVAYAGIGLVVFAVFCRLKVDWLQRHSTWLYILNILMLVAVFFVGRARGEAQRWIDIGPIGFQPSDPSKILLTITLASYYANRQDSIRELKTFLISILHAAPIILLVFAQPHLGGAVALVVIWLIVSIYAGAPWKYFVIAGAIFIGLFTFAWFTPGVMSDYQHQRIESYLNPDPKEGGYQATRSIIAIGSGGLLGAGFLKGEQKAAQYIPEQHSDFVFSVVGEEGGLVGSVIVLACFAFFFYRVWLVGFRARTPMARMLVGGIFGFLAFHTVVNIGMVTQLTPVVGLWLPFVSAGGTALWTCMAAVGLLDTIR